MQTQIEVNGRMMEDMMSAMVNGDLDLARKILSEALLPRGDDPNYPHTREYYEDFVEVLVECVRTDRDPLYGAILIGGVPFEWETTQEMQFLTWIRQLVKRGRNFEEAFEEARQLILELTDVRHDQVVYDLEEDDHILVRVWQERLTERGIELKKAQQMADDIVRLLQQIYLVEADEAFVEEFFSEYERELRQVLLERLDSQTGSHLVAS